MWNTLLRYVWISGTPFARARWMTLFCLVLLATWGLIDSQAPKPSSPSASDTTGFSLSQAQKQLAQLSQNKHPLGSAANQSARDYLVRELISLGYQPQIQTQFVVSEKARAAATVSNIVLRIAGTNTAKDKKALLLVAHYDSAPLSFGASDDGVSVISILQTLKALKQSAALQQDLIVLISDGEEAGLLGAEAFAQFHPWLKDVGMVLNFDNRGNAGPILMFETSPGNGKLIEHFAQASPAAISNSVMYEVYKAMPNDTDFTVFKKRDIAGLNFAMIQNLSSYHTPHDQASLLSPASQQQQGEMMLSLVRHFGQQDHRHWADQNRVYFHLPVVGLVHYPVSWVTTISAFAGLLLLIFLVTSYRQRGLRLGATLLASLAFIFALLSLAFFAQQAWNGLLFLFPHYQDMRDPDPSHGYLLAVILCLIWFWTLYQDLLMKWLHQSEWMAGIAMVWMGLLVACTHYFPGASFLFAWPLMLALLTWIILFNRNEQSLNYGLGLLLGGALSLLLFAPYILMFNVALGFHSLGVPVLVLVLLLGLLAPLFAWCLQGLRSTVFILAIGISLYAAGLATERFHQAQPVLNPVIYAHQDQNEQAYWLIATRHLNLKHYTFFSDQTRYTKMPQLFGDISPNARRSYWMEPRTVIGSPDFGAPQIQVIQDEMQQGQRQLSLLIQAGPRATQTRVTVEGATVHRASVQDQTLSQQDSPEWSAIFHASAAQRFHLKLSLTPHTQQHPLQIRLQDNIYHLRANELGLSETMLPANVDLMAQIINVKSFEK